MSLGDRLHKLDEFQQRRRWLAFIVAVFKKRSDDQGGQLAALIAYYAFLSLFPLLLVFVTVLGFVLQGNAKEQEKVLHSTLAQFPIIGDQIQRNIGSIHGSPVALVIGIIGALLAGLGVTLAIQNAFNRVWGIPFRERPNFIKARLRGLALLLLLGVGNIASTAAAGAAGAGTGSALAKVAAIAIALIVNFGLFMAAFRFLTVPEVRTRDLIPGVILATILWELVQSLGGYYVHHVLRHATEMYAAFSVVIGLLSFLYLGAQLILIAAEVNVVRANHLWPRSILNDPLTPGDERALRESARTEERVDPQTVDVSFDESPETRRR